MKKITLLSLGLFLAVNSALLAQGAPKPSANKTTTDAKKTGADAGKGTAVDVTKSKTVSGSTTNGSKVVDTISKDSNKKVVEPAKKTTAAEEKKQASKVGDAAGKKASGK